MTKLGSILGNLVKTEADKLGMFLVGQSSGEKGLYRFYVDSDGALALNNLTELTRLVSKQIDEGDYGDTPFTFEISTPGADSPLADLRQFGKHLGRSFHVICLDNQEFNGKLTQVNGSELTFEGETTEKVGGKKTTTLYQKTVSFDQIKEATIKISFK